VWAGELSWWRCHIPAVHVSGHFHRYFSVKIVWHEPVDTPTSSATSRTVFHNLLHVTNQTLSSRSWRSTTPLIVIRRSSSPFKPSVPFVGRRLTQSIVTASLTQRVMGFCCCFPQFETKFNTSSLLLYRHHTKKRQNGKHPVIKPLINTKLNARAAWNKLPRSRYSRITGFLNLHPVRMLLAALETVISGIFEQTSNLHSYRREFICRYIFMAMFISVLPFR
jgi:hypothetical protein